MRHRFRKLFFGSMQTLAASVPIIGLVWLAAGPVAAENWTSLDGSRTVQADMVGLWNGNVILRLTDGRRVSVPMQSLIAESRIQAEKIAERLKRERQRLSDELRNVAEAEAAPAPDPLPAPPSTVPAVDMQPGLRPDEAMARIQRQLVGGRFSILVKALPPSMREPLEQMMVESMRETEPTQQQVATLLHRLMDLIVTRQNWIASYPRLQALGENEQAVELFRQLVVPLARAIRDGLPPEAWQMDADQDNAAMRWLQERENAMAPFLAKVLERYAEEPPQWEINNESDDTATLVLLSSSSSGNGASSMRGSFGGNPTIPLVKVEGYWLPKSVAEGFPQLLEQAQKGDAAGLASALGNAGSGMMPGDNSNSNYQSRGGPGPNRGGPGMNEPGMGEPGMGEPGMGEPGMGGPGALGRGGPGALGRGGPGMGGPGAGGPGPGALGRGGPGMGGPGMGGPGMGGPGMGGPGMGGPGMGGPGAMGRGGPGTGGSGPLGMSGGNSFGGGFSGGEEAARALQAQAGTVLMMMGGALTPLENAPDAASFHQALDGLFSLIETAGAMGGARP